MRARVHTKAFGRCAPQLRLVAPLQPIHAAPSKPGLAWAPRAPGARSATASAAAAPVEAPEMQLAPTSYPTAAARQALFGAAPEQVEEVPAVVSGTLPAWLDGCLVVNGGGDYTRMSHMFDGYALVAKVRLAGGRAWGSQRFVQSKAYAEYKRTGKVRFREFGTQAEPTGPLGRLGEVLADVAGLVMKQPNFTDNASVNLHPVGPNGSQLLATSETPAASYLLDPKDLSTLRQVEYKDDVPGDLTTAHPSRLPDGSLLNFTRSLPFGGFHLFKLDPVTLQRKQVAYVPDRRPLTPAWLHDFPACPDYAVLLETPLYMNLGGLLFGGQCEYQFMDWLPKDGTRVTVVRLDGSEPPRSFFAPPFFVFHYANCFADTTREGGRVLHIDMAAYDDPTILNDLALSPLRSDGRSVSRSWLKRLSVPLDGSSGGSLEAPRHLLQPQAQEQHSFCEFPTVNPAYAGRSARYAYYLTTVRPTNMGNALAKADLLTGQVLVWHAPGGAVGEPVFVAAPGAQAEDEGVLLAPAVDAQGRGYLAVLDAQSWQLLASCTLPFAVPYRFHGTWLPGASASASV